MNYNWNWGIFFQTSPDGVHTYLETLLMGTGWTLATALSAWCLALAMGSLIGVIRTTANPWLVRIGTPLAGILISAGFFFSVMAPTATEPGRAIGLIYAGAVLLAVSVVSLGVGLLRAR